MPQAKFYITDSERMELFDFITDNKGSFIPELIYDKPEFTKIQTKEELIECIYEQTVGFYILSPQFQIEPIPFSKFDEKYKNKGKYLIMQRTGGPYISIGFYRGFAEDAPIKYKATDIYHYARYLHHDWQTHFGEFTATGELKLYYKSILQFLKTKCRRVTAKNGKKYWVSKTLPEEEVINTL